MISKEILENQAVENDEVTFIPTEVGKRCRSFPGKPEQHPEVNIFRQVFQRTDAKVKCICALNLHRKNTNKFNLSKHFLIIIFDNHVANLKSNSALYLHCLLFLFGNSKNKSNFVQCNTTAL